MNALSVRAPGSRTGSDSKRRAAVDASIRFDGKNRAIVSHDWPGSSTDAWLVTAYQRPASATCISVHGAPDEGGAGPTSPATGGGPLSSEVTSFVPETDVTRSDATSVPVNLPSTISARDPVVAARPS